MINLPYDALIQYPKGTFHLQSNEEIQVGDFVLDLNDGLVGTCFGIIGEDFLAIQDGFVIDASAKRNLCKKLIPFTAENLIVWLDCPKNQIH